MGEEKKSFLRWLANQAYRMDNTGNFARTIISADNRPSSTDYAEWYEFIEDSGLVSIDVFLDVWKEYREGG